jgi:hypothetical protein
MSRAGSVNGAAGYGDASACLKLRIPLTRRDSIEVTSNRVPLVPLKKRLKLAGRPPCRPEPETHG